MTRIVSWKLRARAFGEAGVDDCNRVAAHDEAGIVEAPATVELEVRVDVLAHLLERRRRDLCVLGDLWSCHDSTHLQLGCNSRTIAWANAAERRSLQGST